MVKIVGDVHLDCHKISSFVITGKGQRHSRLRERHDWLMIEICRLTAVQDRSQRSIGLGHSPQRKAVTQRLETHLAFHNDTGLEPDCLPVDLPSGWPEMRLVNVNMDSLGNDFPIEWAALKTSRQFVNSIKLWHGNRFGNRQTDMS